MRCIRRFKKPDGRFVIEWAMLYPETKKNPITAARAPKRWMNPKNEGACE